MGELRIVLSNEWFIFNHRICFNHCGYGNLWPNYLQLRPPKPAMMRRTMTDYFALR